MPGNELVPSFNAEEQLPPPVPQDELDQVAREAATKARQQIENQAFDAAPPTLDAAIEVYTSAPSSRIGRLLKGTNPYEQNNNSYITTGDPGGTQQGGNFTVHERKGLRGVKITHREANVPRIVRQAGGSGFTPRPMSAGGGAYHRATTSTNETVAPIKGLGIRKRPKYAEGVLVRSTKLASPEVGQRFKSEIADTPDGQMVEGSDSRVTETVRGKRRIVKRAVTTGTNNKGETIIRVEQNSTDLEGNNPRANTWEHRPEDPNKSTKTSRRGHRINQGAVARKSAEVISDRVAARQVQPRKPADEILDY